MRQYKINNADLLAREDISVDQLVDVIQGNRQYKPCLYFYNKIDTITIEEIDQLARMPHSMVGNLVPLLSYRLLLCTLLFCSMKSLFILVISGHLCMYPSPRSASSDVLISIVT
jgi:hypothetical protein